MTLNFNILESYKECFMAVEVTYRLNYGIQDDIY